MHEFLSFLIFESSSKEMGPVAIVSACFQVFASILGLMLWVPPILDVFKLNKTYGLSEMFLLFGFCTGVLFTCHGTYTIIDATCGKEINVLLIVFGAITIVSNVFSGTCNFFFLGKKRANMREALARGLSEMDYYNNHCANKDGMLR